jgi:hypothetical protein
MPAKAIQTSGPIRLYAWQAANVRAARDLHTPHWPALCCLAGTIMVRDAPAPLERRDRVTGSRLDHIAIRGAGPPACSAASASASRARVLVRKSSRSLMAASLDLSGS